jgi:hypothetical protein
MYQNARFQQSRREGKPAPKGDPAREARERAERLTEPAHRELSPARLAGMQALGSIKLI